jgi:hypothetical protein
VVAADRDVAVHARRERRRRPEESVVVIGGVWGVVVARITVE